ncbi:hypothetical protein K439DRAFT_1283248, partial [Ramaria rubella]
GCAIRYQNDFVSLDLVDSRYIFSHINAKLLKWIGKDLIIGENFGHAVKEKGWFF